MDIFIIKISEADNIDFNLLKNFQQKRFSNSTKLKEHCLSYYSVDKILKDFYKIENREIVYKEKKPFLSNKSKFFSISHSNEYIAIAFSDFDCGIDIEKIKQRNYEEIASRIGFKCNSLEDFYCEWTKYEAEYKLGKQAQSYFRKIFDEYAITAVSINQEENFEVYFQIGNNFTNSNA